MVVVQVLGGVLVAVGLFLFVKDQMDGKPSESATTSVWKINLSGPPALVLTFLGAVIFLFPFSGFFKNPANPNPPPPTVVSTTLPQGETTTTVAGTTTTLVAELPPTPTGWDLYVSSPDCGGEDQIVWYQDDYSILWGWWISIATFNPHDETGEPFTVFEIDTGQQADSLTLGNHSALCYSDFVDPEFYLDYQLWVHSYNENGYSEEPLFMEYQDSDPAEGQ